MPRPVVQGPPTVFISYSEKNEVWKERLATQLRVAERQGLLQVWEHRLVPVGDERRPAVAAAIERSSVAVVLVSADFLASRSIHEEEIPLILERQKSQRLRVYPVIVEPCLWQEENWLAPLQVRPRDGQPLAERRSAAEVDLAVIGSEIVELVKQVRRGSSAEQRPPLFAPGRRGAGSEGHPSSPAMVSTMNKPAVILFLAANPAKNAILELDQEAKDIEAKIRAAEHRDSFVLKIRLAVQHDDLMQALNQDGPRIVHFSGHGAPDGIVLAGEDGKPHIVKKEALVETFRAIPGDVRLVVLNACFTREQAEALVEVIDCVVGMEFAIGDKAARVFAASFYRALGFGGSVRNAYDQGLAALMGAGIKEEHKPKLVSRAGVDPDRVFILGEVEDDRGKLTSDQGRRLREALQHAFPSLDDLTIFVADGFGKNLEAIASFKNLQTAAFDLINWASSHSRTNDLVRAAAAARPQDPTFRALAHELGLRQGA